MNNAELVNIIRDVVARRFHVTSEDIMSPRRTVQIAEARRAALHLYRHLGKMTLESVAFFSSRPRNTTTAIIQEADNALKFDQTFNRKYLDILNELEPRFSNIAGIKNRIADMQRESITRAQLSQKTSTKAAADIDSPRPEHDNNHHPGETPAPAPAPPTDPDDSSLLIIEYRRLPGRKSHPSIIDEHRRAIFDLINNPDIEIIHLAKF